jgi:hypothetical protein
MKIVIHRATGAISDKIAELYLIPVDYNLSQYGYIDSNIHYVTCSLTCNIWMHKDLK